MPRSLKFNFLLSQRIRPANLIKLDFKMFAAGFAWSFCPLGLFRQLSMSGYIYVHSYVCVSNFFFKYGTFQGMSV